MATVLVIDDDGALRTSMCRALRSAGHHTLEAADGEAGLAAVQEADVDLVITDVMMPKKDGVETIRAIRATHPDLPIIAVSGSDTAWAAAQRFGWTSEEAHSPLARARMEGANLTVGKPFELRDLFAVIGAALEQVRSRGRPRRDQVTFHVRPERDGWTIGRGTAKVPAARARRRDEAVFLARRLAGGHKRARVVVYNPDGTVDALFAYGDA